MSRRARTLTILLVVLAVCGAGAVAFSRSPIGTAVLKSRAHFIQSETHPSIYYEPGTKRFARMTEESLARSVRTIEQQQYLPLDGEFRVYICASQESFNEYMAAPPGHTARGVKVMNDIFLSPAAFVSWRGDTHEPVLAHELSHLHMYQRIGHAKYLWELPVWFVEGLAVSVSGGGGEGVSVDEAMDAIAAGETFTPDERGSFLRPKRASDYGMGGYMFYRQSGLFLDYIRENRPNEFKNFMLALQAGEWREFSSVFESSFGVGVQDIWAEFVMHVREQRGTGGSA